MVKNYNEILYDNENLYTEHLNLRRFRKSDKADVLEYASDSETLKYLTWCGVKTEEEALDAIINYNWSRPGIFAIEPKDENKCIGCIDIRLDPEHEKAGFGYVLNRKYWGKGYMTEALSAVLKLCFEKLEVNRVEATHYTGNPASGRVMQKCGMELEGILKKEVKIKDIFHDVAHYGILKEDWFEIKK